MSDQADWQWHHCDKCEGTGIVDLNDATWKKCDHCKGEGIVWEWIEE